MIKCHWTDHHHAFFKNNSGQFYECEYCDKVKISSYSVWTLLKEYEELTRHMTFSETVRVELAVVQYLWDRSEESRTAGIPPGASLLGLETHTDQSCSKVGYLKPLQRGWPPGYLEEAPSAGTPQSQDYRQSQSRRPADYYSDLTEELFLEFERLGLEYSVGFESKLGHIVAESKPFQLLLEGRWYNCADPVKLLEWCRTQPSGVHENHNTLLDYTLQIL